MNPVFISNVGSQGQQQAAVFINGSQRGGDQLQLTAADLSDMHQNIAPYLPRLDAMPLAQAIKTLSNQDQSGFPALHYLTNFQFFLTHTRRPPVELLQILSILDSQGYPALYYSGNFFAFLPYFETLSLQDAIQFASIRDRSGKSALEYPSNLQAFLLLTKRNKSTDLVPLFSIRDGNFRTVLEFKENFAVTLPFLEKLPFTVISEVLGCSVLGSTPLHKEDNFQIFITRQNYTPEQLMRLLSLIDRNGNTPLSSVNNFTQLLRFLENKPLDLWIKMLSIQDKRGIAVLSGAVNFQVFLEKQKFRPEALARLLSICDGTGSTPLYFPSNFTQVLGFLQNKPIDLGIKIFSIQDAHGLVPLSYDTNFKVFLQRQTCPPETLVTLLSICARLGRTPLYFTNNFTQLLTFLENKPIDLWVKMLSIQDANGEGALSYPGNFQVFLEKQKFTPEELVQLLSIRSKDGFLAFSLATNFGYLLTFLENKPIDLWVKMLSIQDATGSVALSYATNFKAFLEKQKCTPEELVQFFSSIRSKKGNTTHYLATSFVYLLTFLENKPIDLWIKLFSIQDANGFVALSYDTNFKAFLEKQKFTPEELVQFLSIRDGKENLPMGQGANFTELLTFLKDKPLALYIKIFSIKSKSGGPLLHEKSFFQKILPFLNTLSPEDLEKVVNIKGPKGDSFLHRRPLMLLTKTLSTHLKPFLKTSVNNEGVSAFDLVQCSLSSSWFSRQKTLAPAAAEVTIEDYAKRIESLQVQVKALWQCVHAGLEKGQLSSTLLYIKGKTYSSAEIESALQHLLLVMQKREAWRGTPPADKKEELHRFYSAMLIDYEIVVSELTKRNSLVEAAGTFVDIAKVRIENLCCSAYQGEIEQKKSLLTGDPAEDPSDLDAMLSRAASRALRTQINAFVRAKFGGNVHAYNQLCYVSGLAQAPDPHPLLTVENAQKLIIDTFEPLIFYRNFGQKITDEMAMDWLRLHVPDDFLPEYRQLERSMKEDEAKMFQEMQEGLMKIVPSEKVVKLAQALRASLAPTMTTFNLQNAGKKALLQQLLDSEPFSTSITAPDSYSCEELKDKLDTAFEAYQNTLRKDSNYLSKKRQLMDTRRRLFEEVEAVFQFHQEMEAYQVPLSKRRRLLEIKQVDQSGIDLLGEALTEQGISYSKSQGLPSHACEYARRLAYHEPLLDKRGKMLLEILFQLGVFERKG